MIKLINIIKNNAMKLTNKMKFINIKIAKKLIFNKISFYLSYVL